MTMVTMSARCGAGDHDGCPDLAPQACGCGCHAVTCKVCEGCGQRDDECAMGERVRAYRVTWADGTVTTPDWCDDCRALAACGWGEPVANIQAEV